MEKSVKGIRENYFNSIIKDYQKEREKSFLYRIFWAESARELLKESLPPLPNKNEFREQMKELDKGFLGFLTDEKNGPEQMEEYFVRLPEEAKRLLRVHLPQLPESIVKLLKEHFGQLPEEVEELMTERFPWLLEDEASWLRHRGRIIKLLKENMLERPEWACKVLKQKTPQGTGQEQQKKERRDFWEELMLNDAGYEAWKELMHNNAGYEGNLITDTEYYLWLTEYLTARDIYYKDASISDGHKWLYGLLRVGLGRELEESVKLDEARKLQKEIEKLEKEIMEIKESQKRQKPEESENFKKLEKSRERKEFRKLKKIRELEKLDEPKEPGERERFLRSGKDIRDKAGVGRDLAELAEKLRYEVETGGAEISSRLHGLKCKPKNRKGRSRTEDYLTWLTRQLEKMAIHIKVKTWLQDNGYPIVDDDKARKRGEAKKLLQECRKQDFSMRLFGAYCDSEKGFDFTPKEEGGREADEGWKVRNGFCVWKPDDLEDHLQVLLQALEDDDREDFYIPLAMDLHSGCVFFLAGRGYYAEVYGNDEYAKLKEKYDGPDDFFCYDYLRLDEGKDSQDLEVAFRLQPTFHENVRRSYAEVLSDFKWYCGSGRSSRITNQETGDGESHSIEEMDDIPRLKIKAYNLEVGGDIPKGLQWAFEDQEDLEPSQKAKEDKKRTEEKIKKDRLLML